MISNRAARLRPSGIRKMFERAAGMPNCLDFSIGQPHFEVPAPVSAAAVEAIQSGKNRYTVTEGLPELNEKIAEHYRSRIGKSPERTMVTGGVSGGLTLAYLALLDPGDEILLPEPYFPVYRELAEVLGIQARHYDLYPDFRLTREALEAGVSERTKVLLLNAPANPTGGVFSQQELDLAADFAREHDLTILSDEIYDGFVFDGPLPSVADRYEQTLVLGGFSKTYGVPGWRLGWAAGPEDCLAAMTKLQMFTFVCGNTPAQHAAVVALDLDLSALCDEFRAKRDLLVKALSPAFGTFPVPAGAFYLFPPAPAGTTGTRFVERALEEGMLMVPGAAFSDRDTHFRLSYAVEDSVLERGIEVLLRLADPASSSAS